MSTTLATIRWLSIFTGALSLFYLGHGWFELGLGEVFHQVHEWYVGLVHPVVELLKPVAAWFVELFGVSLPIWWKDAVVLYLAIGGATARAAPAPVEASDERLRAVASNAELGVWAAFALLPISLVAWPIVWLLLDLLIRRRYMQTLRREFGDEPIPYESIVWVGSIRHSAFFEFTRIFAGALIFAGLNAGLG